MQNKIRTHEPYIEAPYDWRNYELPEDDEKAAEVIETVSDYLFLKSQVKSVEKESKKQEEVSFFKKNKDLIIGIGQEAELLYEYVKNMVSVTDQGPNSRQERKQAALNFFRNDPEKFEYIKESFLEDLGIYKFTSPQSKRYFKMCLFDKSGLKGSLSFNLFNKWKRTKAKGL